MERRFAMTDILIRRLLGYSLEDLLPWQKLTKTQGAARFARAWREYNKHAIARVVERASDGDPHAMRWVEERLAKIEAGESRGWQRSVLSEHEDASDELPMTEA
ncbi:MAG: hypothetical protein OXG59_10430 [Gammaproteobacteria bacterium]|nr:hypothetical protein [Gammaproteobacteria bacterium]MCY3940634.1 hypothetical protein [Gammaproteobacteria bacterium]